MDQETLKVGQLAQRTGLSVRTLHHYDQIGLLVPAGRTASGHRLYGSEEIGRLQQIAALRQLGFSLEEIRESLARPGFTLERTLELQMHRLGQQMEHAGRLLERLEKIRLRLKAADRVSVEELMQAIEETIMYDKYYTPEQLEKLEQRRETVGEERIHEVKAEWARLFERFGAEMEKGTDPVDESVLEIARQATGLIQEFTGGDAGIQQSLGHMVSENRESMYAQWGVDPKVAEYMGQAMAALHLAG